MSLSKVKTNVFDGIPALALSNLTLFGNNLRVAIKRRKVRQSDIAEGALISLPTLRNALNGDPRVSMGVYLAILSQLQLDEQIAELANPCSDEIGMALAERDLPTRVRVKKSKYDF
jgi:transcriptional regulator with XRE-family HTH domain